LGAAGADGGGAGCAVMHFGFVWWWWWKKFGLVEVSFWFECIVWLSFKCEDFGDVLMD
jgi:hypothetical protein